MPRVIKSFGDVGADREIDRLWALLDALDARLAALGQATGSRDSFAGGSAVIASQGLLVQLADKSVQYAGRSAIEFDQAVGFALSDDGGVPKVGLSFLYLSAGGVTASGTSLFTGDFTAGLTVQLGSSGNATTVSGPLYLNDNITILNGAGIKFGNVTEKLAFLGTTPITRPSAYTLAGSATRVFPSDPSAAYTGINNAQAGTPYAQVADLNTLRGVVSSLLGVVRQIVTDLSSSSGFGLFA